MRCWFCLLWKKRKKGIWWKTKKNKEKSTKAIKKFFGNLNDEAKETQYASKVLVKYLKEGYLTDQEEKELRTQIYDLLKITGIGVPFVMIPGASLLLPFLVKVAEKHGLDVLPSSFSKKNKNMKWKYLVAFKFI